jgi:hypothetical protein
VTHSLSLQGLEWGFGAIASGDPWLAVPLAYDRDPKWPARAKQGTMMERKFSVAWAEVTIDCQDPETLAAFWSQLLDIAVVDPSLPGWARTESTVAGGPVQPHSRLGT